MQAHQEANFHDGSFERWAKKRSREFPFAATDGVAFYLSPIEVNAEDDFLGDGLVAAGEEPLHHEDEADQSE